MLRQKKIGNITLICLLMRRGFRFRRLFSVFTLTNFSIFFFFCSLYSPDICNVNYIGNVAGTAELNRLEIYRAFFMSAYIRIKALAFSNPSNSTVSSVSGVV